MFPALESLFEFQWFTKNHGYNFKSAFVWVNERGLEATPTYDAISVWGISFYILFSS